MQGPAPDWAMAALGAAQRDGGSHERFVRNGQQRPKVAVDELVPTGHHASIAQCPRRQQQVLAGRVDRCAVHREGLAMADHAGQDQHRHLVQVLDVVLHGPGHGRLGRRPVRTRTVVVAVGVSLGVPDTPGGGRHEPLGRRGLGPVGEHQEPEGLPV